MSQVSSSVSQPIANPQRVSMAARIRSQAAKSTFRMSRSLLSMRSRRHNVFAASEDESAVSHSSWRSASAREVLTQRARSASKPVRWPEVMSQ